MITQYLSKKRHFLPLDGNTYDVLGFGKFFRLQLYKESLVKCLREKSSEGFIDSVKDILSLYGEFDLSNALTVPVLLSVLGIISNNILDKDIAMLKPIPEDAKERGKPEAWSYSDRHIANYIHLLAKNYGWSLADILDLDPNLAFHLLQEVIADNHHEKEWNYRLTEFAYKYDKGSKSSTYVPLNKPYWMREEVYSKAPTTQRLLISALPFGNVQDLTGMGKYGEKANQ